VYASALCPLGVVYTGGRFTSVTYLFILAFSVLTLLVGWQEGHPACTKTEWLCAGVVICLERGADLHMAQLMPLPLTVSCSVKVHIGFTVLVPAHPGIVPEKGSLNGCLCVLLLIFSLLALRSQNQRTDGS